MQVKRKEKQSNILQSMFRSTMKMNNNNNNKYNIDVIYRHIYIQKHSVCVSW